MSAKWKWTIAIVGLLVGNIVAMVVLMMAASSTSPAIVPDYYERAAHYDRAIDEAARSRALGWTSDVRIAGASVEVAVRDRSGAPIDGATVKISGYARAHANTAIEASLVATGSGTYRATLPSSALGMHDLTVVVDRRDERFVASVTVEAR